MNTITFKILVFILSLFILITVANQLILRFEEDYITETAMMYSSAEKISLKGIYVRKESVINSTVSGVLSYPVPDGSKIAKDSVVAYIYRDSNSIAVNQQIEKLTEEVKLLESAQSPGTTNVAQPEFISSLINEKYQTITSLIAKNNLSQLSSERKTFQTLLGIYQIVINEETDYNDRINSLNKQITALQIKQKEPIDVVTVSDSGYFVSHVDGYESVLYPEMVKNVDISLLKKIINDDGENNKSSKYTVGKMVDGYNWSMVGIVNPNLYDVHVDAKVKLKFTSTPDIVNAVVTDLIKTDNTDESIIIISCDRLTYNFVQRRVERVELVLNDYEGIKVPREAVRFSRNNEKGVYIRVGEKVMFKKIDTIYECDEYLLSRFTSESGYISVYDDIIIKGEVNPDDFIVTTVTTQESDITSVITTTTDVGNNDVTQTITEIAAVSEAINTESVTAIPDSTTQALINNDDIFE